MFCALLNVFIISFFTRVRDSYSTDLVSKWGVCFGVRGCGIYDLWDISSKISFYLQNLWAIWLTDSQLYQSNFSEVSARPGQRKQFYNLDSNVTCDRSDTKVTWERSESKVTWERSEGKVTWERSDSKVTWERSEGKVTWERSDSKFTREGQTVSSHRKGITRLLRQKHFYHLKYLIIRIPVECINTYMNLFGFQWPLPKWSLALHSLPQYTNRNLPSTLWHICHIPT